VLVTACNDGFLERLPLSDINDTKYWKTSNDLRLYVNNFYNQDSLLWKDNGWGSLGIYGLDADKGSDTQVRLSTNDENDQMNGKFALSKAKGWKWGMLRDINYFLSHYKVVEELEGEDVVKPYVGEALFFRASFYFTQLKMFGNLPIVDVQLEPESPELYNTQAPRNEVVAFMLKDLDDAISYLPARAGGAYSGRIVKEVALALKARVALYEGTWEKYHKGDPFAAAEDKSVDFLTQAADAAGELITMSEANGYPALDNVGQPNGYRDLFIQHDYSSSKEVMLWRKYQKGVITNNWTRYSLNGAGRGMTKSMLESYLCTDGDPIGVSPLYLGDATLLNVATGRDPRLGQTVQIPDLRHYIWTESSPVKFFWAPAFDGWDAEEMVSTGYQIYKGHDINNAAAPAGDTGEQAMIYYRFGETLLNYAEAKAELGTLTQADLDRSINLLRRRVGMPDMRITGTVDPGFEFAGLGYIIQSVRRERKVELAAEGFRHDDIMRWAAVKELILGKKPQGAFKKQWDNFNFKDLGPLAETDYGRQADFDKKLSTYKVDKEGYIDPFGSRDDLANGFQFNEARDYLWPIPDAEIRLNNKLKQNPGW
jgi:hypothetical protein